MRYGFISTAIGMAVVLLIHSNAQAQMWDIGMSPFDVGWSWATPPMQGNVLGFSLSQESTPPAPGGKPSLGLAPGCTFSANRAGGTDETIGPKDRPNWIITRNAKGQVTQVVSFSFRPQAKGLIKSTETATFDANGWITQITSRRSDGIDTKTPLANEKTADGGHTSEWTCPGIRGMVQINDATFNAKGQVVQLSFSHKGEINLHKPETVAYNDHGDLTEYTHDSRTETFAYDYDTAGNWIRRTHVWIDHQNGKEIRTPQRTYVRTIEYGHGGAIAKAPGKAAPPIADSPTTAPANPKGIEGTYTCQQGKTGDPVLIVMKITLQAGGKLTFATNITTPANMGGNAAKSASGSYTVDGDNVTLHLEKADNGADIPEDQRTLQLQASADRQSLTVAADNQTFQRDNDSATK